MSESPWPIRTVRLAGTALARALLPGKLEAQSPGFWTSRSWGISGPSSQALLISIWTTTHSKRQRQRHWLSLRSWSGGKWDVVGDASVVGGGNPHPPWSPAGQAGVEASRITWDPLSNCGSQRGLPGCRSLSLSWRASILSTGFQGYLTTPNSVPLLPWWFLDTSPGSKLPSTLGLVSKTFVFCLFFSTTPGLCHPLFDPWLLWSSYGPQLFSPSASLTSEKSLDPLQSSLFSARTLMAGLPTFAVLSRFCTQYLLCPQNLPAPRTFLPLHLSPS